MTLSGTDVNGGYSGLGSEYSLYGRGDAMGPMLSSLSEALEVRAIALARFGDSPSVPQSAP